MRLIDIAKSNRKLKNEKALRVLIKKFKKKVKQTVANGKEVVIIDIDETHVYGIEREDEEGIYKKAIEELEPYYKGQIEFDIEHHGFLSSYIRLRGVLK